MRTGSAAWASRTFQPEGRRLVHAELGRDLGDPRLAAPPEELQDAESPVDGLHERSRLAVPWVALVTGHEAQRRHRDAATPCPGTP